MFFITNHHINYNCNRYSPLYVGNYYRLPGMPWKSRKSRQQMIFSIALAWKSSIRKNPKSPGFIKEEIFLTQLTKKVYDSKHILEQFFNIEKIGFKFSDDTSPTIISPKKLPNCLKLEIDKLSEFIETDEVVYSPGIIPKYKTKSLVNINQNLEIIKKLKDNGRYDLIPQVTWLQQYKELDFYFQPSGILKQRDTSVWPIKCIELWPGWLRKELFGKSIDIENAFCQFLIQQLETKYEKNPKLFELKYPDLIAAYKDKDSFRKNVCDLLKLEENDKNLSTVKKLIMSLANGSNITPLLLINNSIRCQAARIINTANPNLTINEKIEIGNYLHSVTKQFRSAKRMVCIHVLKIKPTRKAQEQIFHLYFKWERIARYNIWEIVGNTGLHLHDGLDGIITNKADKDLIGEILEQTGVRVSID